MSADKCPNCGHPRLDATEGDGFLCGSHGEWKTPECIERAARKKAEKALAHMTFQADKDHARWKLEADDLAKERYAHAETRRKLDRAEEEIERLHGEKCAALYEAERERQAKLKMREEMERQAELATLGRMDADQARRELQQWREIAGELAAALGETNKADPIPGADESLERFKQAEKGAK